MNIRQWLGAGAMMAIQLGANASTGSVDFQLNDLPSLASSAAAADASGAAGYWITDNRYTSQMLLVRDWQGSSASIDTRYGSTDAGAGGLSGVPFGSAQGQLAWAPDVPMSSSSYFREGSLGTAWQSAADTDLSFATLNWGRSFALKPQSSVTLAGTLSYTFSAGALEPRYESHLTPVMRGNERGVASLRFEGRDVGDTPMDSRNAFDFDMIGTIHYFDPREGRRGQGGQFSADDIAYSIDSFGHLSMTIFNRSSELLFGSFYIGSSGSSVPISAIPEPATWAAMLLGLGGICLARRRSRPQSSRAAANGSSL